MNNVKLLHIKCCFFQLFNRPVALKNKKNVNPLRKSWNDALASNVPPPPPMPSPPWHLSTFHLSHRRNRRPTVWMFTSKTTKYILENECIIVKFWNMFCELKPRGIIVGTWRWRRRLRRRWRAAIQARPPRIRTQEMELECADQALEPIHKF